MKAFLTAGLALATCAAFAAITKQDFAGMNAGESPSGAPWYGDGGKYAAKTSGSNDMVLAIEGSMICSNAPAAAVSEFVKTSFKVKAPSEGTATTDLPTGDDVAGCQIAVATGETLIGDDSRLKVMVFEKSGEIAAWTPTDLTVETNSWFDITLSFDYQNSNAYVQVGNSVATGPYKLVTPPANDATKSKIASLAFVGAAEIDDVLIDEALAKIQLASNIQGLQVYENELPQGVTVDHIKSGEESSNYTKRIEAGLLSSAADFTFNATALTTETEGNVVKTVITVPCEKDYGQVYKVVITKANGDPISGSPVTAEAGAISENSRALKFVMPETEEEEKVLKFTVQSGNGN